jgi:DNA-binding transcriptional regulator YhcF (GntR family)
MSSLTKANNTIYFKAFNDDYRIGGIYHSLDNSEFRCIVILQAYSDGEGMVVGRNGKSYNKKDLAGLMGLNGRTTERALLSLRQLGIISMSDDETITISHFINDNVYRGVGSNKVTRGRANLAKGIKKNRELQEEQNRLLAEISNKVSLPQQIRLVDSDGVITDGIKGGNQDAG